MPDGTNTNNEKRVDAAQTRWVMMPQAIQDRLEDFDTAIILACAAAANAGEVRHWEACLHDLRRARSAMDEMAGPGVTRRLI